MNSARHWRAAVGSDLPAVCAIAEQVHPAFPEEAAVFEERLRLYPAGLRVLVCDGEIEGYIVGHPWLSGTVPALDTLLHALPTEADTFYLHDLALLPSARGSGMARVIVEELAQLARSAGFPTMRLVAVNGSVPLWQHLGFAVDPDAALAKKLRSYGDAARPMVRRLSLPSPAA